MTAAVSVRGLRKHYGAVEALRDLDLEVSEGEVLAILGPNGAGKTTLMEILEGFRARDAGAVSVLGEDPTGAPRSLRRRVGIVLQECAVPPYLSVGEVVRMCAAYYPAPRDVDEILRLVGMDEKANSRVLKLSGGQRRRLDLALALVGDPELIFLDEPTTGFDPTARRQAWQVVRDIRALGRTVVLTTHYMDEAQALADRIVVIAGGRVVAEGDAASIGGRADAAVAIRFQLPAGVRATELPVAATAVDGSTILLRTTAPTRALAALCGWAAQRDVELAGLVVERPTLEDVYLGLTAAEPARA